MEPNARHRSVQVPTIMVQGNEGPVYLDCTEVVSSIIISLGMIANRGNDGEWLLDMLSDIDVLHTLEGRGMTATDTSAQAKIQEILEQTGTPVIELSAGQAIQYAKRFEDAADAVSNDIDRQTRYEFRLREARKLVEAQGVIDRRPSLATTAPVLDGAASIKHLNEKADK